LLGNAAARADPLTVDFESLTLRKLAETYRTHDEIWTSLAGFTLR
jgi:hypothetical protein